MGAAARTSPLSSRVLSPCMVRFQSFDLQAQETVGVERPAVVERAVDVAKYSSQADAGRARDVGPIHAAGDIFKHDLAPLRALQRAAPRGGALALALGIGGSGFGHGGAGGWRRGGDLNMNLVFQKVFCR